MINLVRFLLDENMTDITSSLRHHDVIRMQPIINLIGTVYKYRPPSQVDSHPLKVSSERHQRRSVSPRRILWERKGSMLAFPHPPPQNLSHHKNISQDHSLMMMNWHHEDLGAITSEALMAHPLTGKGNLASPILARTIGHTPLTSRPRYSGRLSYMRPLTVG
jgi:hypothetical protein